MVEGTAGKPFDVAIFGGLPGVGGTRSVASGTVCSSCTIRHLANPYRVWDAPPRMADISLMQSAPGPETVIDDVRYLYFGGTSYLGLAAHPEVIEAGCAALREFGLHTATSRARIGTSPPVRKVERRAAEFFGTEDSFYFVSGYCANHILVAALAPGMEAVLVDEAAHYCVLEGARLAGVPASTFRHQNAADLARLAHGRRRVLVMADAVGPATGGLAPVPDYLRALEGCERASLLLDDAHGFGVLGEHGRGLLDELDLWPKVNRSGVSAERRTLRPQNGGALPRRRYGRGTSAAEVSLYVGGTLSKALGGFGGIIPGTREFVARVRTASHYFDGASAPASPVAAATAKALEIVMREPSLRRQLRDNTLRLRAGLRALGLTVPEGATAHFGVSVGNATNMQRIHEALKARGIMLPYVAAYSGIPKEGLLRFAVFANHTAAQLDHLLAELRSLV
jgi:7-keto-8-aminopelargonate synthetase-like enzyme